MGCSVVGEIGMLRLTDAVIEIHLVLLTLRPLLHLNLCYADLAFILGFQGQFLNRFEVLMRLRDLFDLLDLFRLFYQD